MFKVTGDFAFLLSFDLFSYNVNVFVIKIIQKQQQYLFIGENLVNSGKRK